MRGRFQHGDRVTVLSGDGVSDYVANWNPKMEECVGLVFTIDEEDDYYNDGWHVLEQPGSRWIFDGKYLVLAPENQFDIAEDFDSRISDFFNM